jgi:hypothetical protein
VKIND